MRKIKTLLRDEVDGIDLEDIFICPCSRCNRDGGSTEDRATHYGPRRAEELRTEYASIFALLIYMNRPGLIRIFQTYEMRIHYAHYLREEDFSRMQREHPGILDFDTVKSYVLAEQYNFFVRALRLNSDITKIPAQEVLPIKEDLEPKGEGSFAEVRCFEFQDPEYRSRDFGQVRLRKFG